MNHETGLKSHKNPNFFENVLFHRCAGHLLEFHIKTSGICKSIFAINSRRL